VNLTKFLEQQSKFTDERVDNMRKQKDEELEQYKRDIERQKRFEQKQP
jgi:ribosomal protein L44E